MTEGHIDDEEGSDQDRKIEQAAPDGGWGWVVVFGAFMVYFIADGCVFSFGVFYNELLDYFRESKGKTAVIPAMLYGFPLLLSPFVCTLVNNFGCRPIGMIGGFLVGLGFFISHFGSSVEFLILSIGVCCSVGLQMSYIAAIMTVTYYFEARRGLATGLAVAGSGIGTFAFPPIFEGLIMTYAWRGAALILSGICFNIVTGCCLFRPVVAHSSGGKTQVGEINASSGKRQEPVACHRKDTNPKIELEKNNGGEETQEQEKLLSQSKTAQMCHKMNNPENVLSISSPSVFISNCSSKDTSLTVELENSNESGPILKQKDHLLSEGAGILHKHNSVLNRKYLHSDQDLHDKKAIACKWGSLQLQDPHCHSSINPVGDEASKGQVDNTVISHGCAYYLLEFKQAMLNMFDITLLRQPGFLLICLSNFMLCLCYGAPYIYIVDKASLHGIEKLQASFLVSIIGITSTIGQVVLGFMVDKLKNCVFIYEVSMLLCGISTLLIPVCTSYESHCMTVAVFGFFISANYSLTTLMLIQVVGLDKLTTAFGFLQLGQGIGTVLGTPFVGLLYDKLGSYSMAFYIAGACICLSSVILLPLHWLIRDDSCFHRKPERINEDLKKS